MPGAGGHVPKKEEALQHMVMSHRDIYFRNIIFFYHANNNTDCPYGFSS